MSTGSRRKKERERRNRKNLKAKWKTAMDEALTSRIIVKFVENETLSLGGRRFNVCVLRKSRYPLDARAP